MTKYTHAHIIWCTLILLTVVTSSVHCVNNCPLTATGCFCNHDVIDCEGAGLTSVPTFRRVSGVTFNELWLQNNQIQHVPANAFQNLKVFVINLSNNSIRSIEDGAFNGVLNISSLDISHNRLTRLPSDLKGMVNLQSLNIMQNRIDLDSLPDHDNILYSLGDTVKDFGFGSDLVTRWPYFMHHMQRLEKLAFEGRGIRELPINAFQGFKYRLRVLKIRNTDLKQVPLALATLENLNEFYYENNVQTGNAGMIPAAFMDLVFGTTSYGNSFLRVLSLKNNSMTSYPTVIKMFPRLEAVYLDDNSILFVDDEAVENTKGPIHNISARNCDLFRIPNFFFRMNKLYNLDLSHNNIASIYRNDFYFSEYVNNNTKPSMKFLNLADNPLGFIDDHAFDILDNMATVDLSNINIKVVPKAIRGADNLHTVILNGTNVECTCDLRWIKNDPDMANRNISYQGRCETINMNLDTYIATQVSRERCGD